MDWLICGYISFLCYLMLMSHCVSFFSVFFYFFFRWVVGFSAVHSHMWNILYADISRPDFFHVCVCECFVLFCPFILMAYETNMICNMCGVAWHSVQCSCSCMLLIHRTCLKSLEKKTEFSFFRLHMRK